MSKSFVSHSHDSSLKLSESFPISPHHYDCSTEKSSGGRRSRSRSRSYEYLSSRNKYHDDRHYLDEVSPPRKSQLSSKEKL